MQSFQLATIDDIETMIKIMPIYYEYDHLVFDETKARATLNKFFSTSEFGRIWLLMDEEGKQGLGYIVTTFGFSMEYGGKVALIDELFVLEKHRGKGFGSRAIKHVQEESKKLGIETLRLEVTKNNQRVISLYQKLGFKDLGRSLLVAKV